MLMLLIAKTGANRIFQLRCAFSVKAARKSTSAVMQMKLKAYINQLDTYVVI
jgi:hypothetical protein